MISGGGQTSLSSLTEFWSGNKMSRIIRDFAGVTSRSTKRAGFAYAHTAPYRSCSFACNGNSAFSFRKQSLFQRKVLQPQLTHAKSGFTLAEVLITLGIIGVVAAMTLPAINAHYRKKEIPVKLKKFTSTMQNALNMATVDYGSASSWDYPSKQNNADQIDDFVNKYLFPYLSGIRRCDAGERACREILKTLYPSGRDIMPVYIFSDGGCFGMLIGGASTSSAMMHITYDYNCLAKPNEYDKDIFGFVLVVKQRQSPVFKPGTAGTWNLKTREALLNLCKNHLSSPHYKGGCSALIQYDGWEIKEDYPW